MSEEVPKGETSCCGCKYEHDDSCNIGKLCRAGEESLQAENKRLKNPTFHHNICNSCGEPMGNDCNKCQKEWE